MRWIKLDEDMERLWYFEWVLLILKQEEQEMEKSEKGELQDWVESATLAVIESIYGVSQNK